MRATGHRRIARASDLVRPPPSSFFLCLLRVSARLDELGDVYIWDFPVFHDD